MRWLICVVLALVSFVALPAQADEITQRIASIRAEEPRLNRSVTVWRPALLVGDLLEQASEQTGLMVYAEDTDGAASEIVLAYVKDMSLGDLMESLASLLSEKGAFWEWRKTENSKGKRGYRLVRTRQAAGALTRQRNYVREVFLRSTERALVGNVKNDPGAAHLLNRFKEESEYLRANTTPAQRRAALFLENHQDEVDGISRSWHVGDLFPTLIVPDKVYWMLDGCEQAHALVLQELAKRWLLSNDQRDTERVERVTAQATDADALESVARSTGRPVLARRSLWSLPSRIAPDSSMDSLRREWTTEGAHFYLSKCRGRTLLLSEVAVDDDAAGQRLRLPWKFYKELRIRMAKERNIEDSLVTLSWLLSHVPSELASRFASHNCQLIPLDLFASVEMVGYLVTERGTFSSSGSGLVLASLGGQSSLIQQALTPNGVSYEDSPSRVQEALKQLVQPPYSVLKSMPNVVRWRMELNADSEPTKRGDFGDRARQWRYRRASARWSGSVTIFLKFEGEEERAIRSMPVHSPDLEFLPAPGK